VPETHSRPEPDPMGRENVLLAAARRRWAVHPLRPGDKRPLLKDWPPTHGPKTTKTCNRQVAEILRSLPSLGMTF